MINYTMHDSKFRHTIDKITLKHGFCSYFSLAYFTEIEKLQFIRINEYDDELDKEFLVHIVLQSEDGVYIDSLGSYENPYDSLVGIEDLDHMKLRIEYVNYDQIVKQILNEIHFFDDELLVYVRTYVRDNYTKK